MKKRAVVICPGRGTYTKETLGYLRRHGGHIAEFLADIDNRRRAADEPTITALDGAEVFKPQVHTRGEHASSLIYACAYADFMAIDRDKFDIVAVTGNSMGWYLALAMGGALDWAGAFQVINTMGSMMKEEIIGGQVIYPVCGDDWRPSPEREAEVERVVAKLSEQEGFEIHPSIYLGGYVVIGANRPAINALLKELPKVEDYPFQLINHAAFHTPLMRGTSERAFTMLGQDLFHAPETALIDGQGKIWQPYSTDVHELHRYTLGYQVVEPYDFTGAITVALREFAPDTLILLGPGGSLGGAVGQILVQNNWLGIESKSDFTDRQKGNPLLLAMGRPEQRPLVAG
jgi:[acyl-carrier-protein] S-malonyltransferase